MRAGWACGIAARIPRSPDWKYYGAWGITVCDEWRDFERFVADMGPPPSPRHTLERRNPFMSYTKANTVWATPEEQSRNRRNSRRRSPEEKRCLVAAWLAEMQIPMFHTGDPFPPRGRRSS